MKKLIFTLTALLLMQSAHALIVSVKGEGEVSEEGMSLIITEGEEDILTGKYTMELEGDVLISSGELEMQIIRSANGLEDEFCCGNNCTAGNGETEETKTFNFNGMAHWYSHYVPVLGSNETIRYIFRDGEESLEVRVQYVYQTDAVSEVKDDKAATSKILRDGQVYILRDGQRFTVTGTMEK